MKTRTLWQVEVQLPQAQEEQARELLAETFHQTPYAYIGTDSLLARISVYLPNKPTPKTMEALGAQLSSRLGHPPSTVQVRCLKARDWVKAWQRHIKPLHIGKALLIRPSWDSNPPQPGQQVIVLDPGLSFGTGHHPTTRYCLHELVRLARLKPASFLDLGTGSGLLAIAATRLGYRTIQALDNDPEAVRVARANARTNGVGRRIRFFAADVASHQPALKNGFEVVAANLTDELLIKQARRIAACVAPGGWLVVAGILAELFPPVRQAYEKLGLQCQRQRTHGDWTGATFRLHR